MLLLLHLAFMLSVVKLLLKGEVGVCALNSHGNYIVDHGKIMELCLCGNPVGCRSSVINIYTTGWVLTKLCRNDPSFCPL